MKALIFGADGFEDLELFYPYHRLKEEGITTHIASMKKGPIKGKQGYEINADVAFKDVNPADYDILVISGGKGPEKMRLDESALEIVRHFFKENKPVAAICHGPQVLISAGVIKGRKATCWIGIRDDIIAAGALYEDKEVVIDGNLVSSRSPADLHAFGREMIKLLSK
ncbi:MAG: type 1 glutamine amidotransferase domain-containing protein [Methanosarcina thermophila]|jgi:protease I|uniref:PfpI peptidase, Cysteine peptidase, MEROPS family C56 n=3 Tax=Methanosarcina thermophila TaxID=2210 RepID=A0A1I6ZUX0_METTE|nr:type 1 glutamine amidotransferase domain-containing protein [Methanosarcina thermophila]ALK06060.1 MAG: peptidase [Methanosarcina sp. 795]AKB12350.1 ThiJ/PfpI family protein [Methanosarcina thermophila TM-1]AKB14446.1 ThiJ/PfpI family protein [Methanosarcina thermophila CHTI-55]NLU57043.1 type 1 glutamine amidotransferase [Methanosarcina thermophila]SFT66484.1 PfpI peptidase. Cysteine peptidase. MEROPS family C56 [Methanosarcina thermophila]